MGLENFTMIDAVTPVSHTCFQISTATAFRTDNISMTPYIVNATVNSAFSVVTTTANMLVLLAILKTTSIHLPSRLLLISLVLTDLAVGLIAEPLFVTFLITKVSGRSNDASLCLLISSNSIVGASMGCVSLMNMTAISLDRYVAFHHHLKYREIVTTRRVLTTLVVTWAVAAGFVSSWFQNRILYISLAAAIIFACTVVTLVAYSKIYRGLRRQNGCQEREQNTEQRQSTLDRTRDRMDIARYRRTASSMLWIYCLSTLCYMPYVCVEIFKRFVGLPVLMQCIFEFSVTAVYLSSLLNPFVYCLRLPEIRAGVMKILRKMRCQSLRQ